MYQSALNLAKSFDISDSMPRRGGRQTTIANHPAEAPKQHWRISLYYPFLDNLITNLKHVSLNLNNRFHAQHLLPRAVETMGRFWTILRNSIEVIKTVLDSMLYETLKWPQIAPFCIPPKTNIRPASQE